MTLLLQVIFFGALAGLVYTYVGYPLLLLATHWFTRRRASRPDDDARPPISIVLAAYNESDYVRAKLENCLALDYPGGSVEILVGSDGSDDGTNEIIQEFANKGVVLLPFEERRGKMAVVNDVVRKASGEICIFSDISELFDRDALLKLVRHFADPSIGAVTGNHVYNDSQTGLGSGTAFYWKFQRFLQQLESRLYSVFACDGTIYACRRSLFPFPADGTINDDVAVPLGVLCQGKRVIFEAKAFARGDVLPETGRFFNQKIRGQAGKYQNFAAFKHLFLPWPPKRWWIFISHSVMPVMVPWLMLLALVSNALLIREGPLFQVAFAAQAAFYLLALAGLLAERVGFYVSLLAIPFYFVIANVGSMMGFFAYITGVQRSTWKKVE